MKKLCPFNQFQACKGEQCAVSIKSDDSTVCSLTMIAHELFLLADLGIRNNETTTTETSIFDKP